ncbi:MAG: ATP-binding protein [Bacteroidetes bacterium]|nr:ATP-binding protein [Bacteroidota bacterium]
MLKLPSNLRSIHVLDSFVQDLVHQYKISQEVHGNMLISLTEAVTNAITHGNHYDENKVVQINLQKKSDTIAIRVSDQGCGFDPANVPDPTCEENICKCGGRGVFLMQRLCDQIQYKDNGRTVEMHFKI